MGLDQYLNARKYMFMQHDRTEDGLPIKMIEMELAYWRKHPNLHGFIVQQFAGGEDNCQDIDLTAEAINVIIDAVQNDQLPETQGFFFHQRFAGHLAHWKWFRSTGSHS